jgi:Periplasmic protein involved in polysaccharide export
MLKELILQMGENGYVKAIEVDLNKMDDFELKPYDIVNIRRLPEFSFQQVVSIVGEVKYPGNYSISGKSEKLFNIIERAGGVTSEAFLEGGYIEREEDSVGLVVIKIGDLIKSQKSKYNYLIKPKDIIHIPKESNIVSIMGEIGYTAHSKNGDTKISCPYSKNKRAGRYIRNYGGGFGKNAKKYNVYVIRQNGLVEDSKFFGLIRPIVKKGDVIKVEPKKQKKQKTEENRIDWNRTIESLSVKITGLATFWVLAQQINP